MKKRNAVWIHQPPKRNNKTKCMLNTKSNEINDWGSDEAIIMRCLILNKLIFLKKCKWLRIRHLEMQNAPTLNHKDAHSISRRKHNKGAVRPLDDPQPIYSLRHHHGRRFQKSDKKQNDKKHTKTQSVTPSTATSAPSVQNQRQYTKTQRDIEQTTLRGAATETQKLDKLLALKLHSKKARIQTPGKSKKLQRNLRGTFLGKMDCSEKVEGFDS